MSDDIDNEKEHEEESFADLFESYSSGMKDDLKVGDKISARIISIGKDSVFLDTGSKVDGVVERTEMLDKNGNMPYHEGDQIELFVVSQNEHEIRLSKAIAGLGGIELLTDAFASAIPVEGKVSATCKGGFHVELLQRRAFCPISQIDVNFVENPDDYVGQTFQFLITQLEERGRNIVVSRRKLLAQAIEKEKEAFLSTLNKGDLLNGRVTRLMPYGAFVELAPGVEGMVHISELSWSRVQKPDEIVQVDDTVSVKVVDIGTSDKKKQKKISLSMKQVSGDPWDTVAEKIHAGDKVNGKVTRCMDFGAFVEIAPGIEGLVHVSEMSYVKRIVKPDDVVAPGETVSVLVKELNLDTRRISLSLRDAEGDPWLEVSQKFRNGQVVSGTLEKKEKFGYFISLAPGITGLLPKSKIAAAEKPAVIEGLKTGDPLTVTIEAIRPLERKISLAPGDAADEGAWKNFAQAEASGPVSDLAEKLRQAMSVKNNS
ncbi:MAG: 30S ribosomal protein S1 [Thermodesulfobacteriota bacterium]